MDHPDTDEVTPEKLEEVKEEILSFSCDLYDSEIIHKIALALLPGLGAACIDNTTGGLFRSPATVALDMRRAMVEYLTSRSETFVAESIILEDSPEASDHPYDIIADFIEDFATSKRNFFSRVSGWILSERREDRIDDFVQDMEMDGFWILDRRESIAKTLLKNVDTKNLFHCNMKFNSEAELAEHSLNCSFRTIDCMHEGCDARFSATHLENHESICPFKIIPCEQKCPANIMRRQMDRHCITVCPMKVINCTFSSAGCQSTFPQSETEHHRVQNLLYHIALILRVIHKDKDAADEDLEERSKKVEEMASPGKLASARDVRSLTLAVKDVESKLGPLQIRSKNAVSDTEQELPTAKNESTESSIVAKESDKEHNQKPSSPPSVKGILEPAVNTTKHVAAEESSKKPNSPTIKESIMSVGMKEDNNGLIKTSSMKGTPMVTKEENIKESNESLSMKENLKDTAEEGNRQPNRSSSMKGNVKNTEEEDSKLLNSSSSMKKSFNVNVNANINEEDGKKEPNVSSSIDRSLNTKEVSNASPLVEESSKANEEQHNKESNVSALVKEMSKANEEEDKKESNIPPLLKESLKTSEEKDKKEANAPPLLKESPKTNEVEYNKEANAPPLLNESFKTSEEEGISQKENKDYLVQTNEQV